MKNFKNRLILTKGTDGEKEIPHYIRVKLDFIFIYLCKGLTYEDLLNDCPEMNGDDINAALWYLAKKGIKNIPTISCSRRGVHISTPRVLV